MPTLVHSVGGFPPNRPGDDWTLGNRLGPTPTRCHYVYQWRLSVWGIMEGEGSYLVERPSGLEMGNRFLSLAVDTSKGLQPNMLFSKHTSLTYADLPYLYRVQGKWEIPAFLGADRAKAKGFLTLTLKGKIGPAVIAQRFQVPQNEPYIEEVLTVENQGSDDLATPGLAMGFARSLDDEAPRDCRIISVPFRRDLRGTRGEYQEYSLDEIAMNHGFFCPRWPQREATKEFGAEGWIWTYGDTSLLVAKHAPELIEFSILSTEEVGGKAAIRFGGACVWHGDPEEGTRIEPGSRLSFSATRYVLVQGGLREGYYAFRNYMESLGHKTPRDFDPPVHWNELYDNPLWWQGDSFENRRRLYTLAHMEDEAAKAREVGCEALYLDPGWDTAFGSSIWASYRLKDAKEFVKLMGEKYGLKVSLHMPLAAWCDVTAYPLEAHKRDREGAMQEGLCGTSPAYLKTKKQRLIELAKAGFAYYMYDGSGFTGPCWDASHGHSIPLTRSEHCRAVLELIQAVHRMNPALIIELHDPILAGVPERYAPMHYLHGVGPSFDEGWAFEYMWDPMDDLISGRAVSLYYYNMAYSLPLYIHIDLRKDNENALEFWWYASTCRHLGIGGKHMDPKVWDAHKRAMRTYMRLRKFYTQGIFLGLEEEVHLHRLPGEKRLVLNVFNLEAKAMVKVINLDLSQLGFAKASNVSEGKWTLEGDRLSVELELEGRDARVLEILCS